MRSSFVCLSTALALVACKGSEQRRMEPAPSPSAVAPAPDQLRPGELAEGTVDAFGLKLPRLFSLDARFPDAAFASGEVRAEHVTSYIRERVVSDGVETIEVKTVFKGATLKSSPAHRLRIEVVARGDRTELIVRDETRPPAKAGLTEEERWRELGLTPQGAPLDPTKLE